MAEEEMTTSNGPAYVPPAVIDFLGSEEAVNTNLEIMDSYGLKDQDMTFIFELLWDVIERRKSPKAVRIDLKEHFKRWDDEKINKLAVDLLGKKLLPLSNMISGVEDELKSLGADPKDFSDKRIVPPRVTVAELARNMINDLQVPLTDKFLIHRLENIVNSKLKGIRDDFETKNRLIRGSKIGGLDIAPSLADKIIDYIDDAQNIFEIVEEKPHAAAEHEEEKKKIPQPEVAEQVPEEILKKETGTTEAYTVRPEDIEEIESEEKKEISSEAIGEYRRVEQEIIKESGYNFSDPDMQTRFKNAVQARVRDVRDELETRNLLTRAPQEGGLGLSPEKASRLIELIKKYTEPLKERLSKIEDKKKKEALERAKQEREEEKAKEKAELDKRFAKLTGRTPAPLPKDAADVEPTVPLKEEVTVPTHRKEMSRPAVAKSKAAKKAPAPEPTKKPTPVPVKGAQIAPPPPTTSVPAVKPTQAAKPSRPEPAPAAPKPAPQKPKVRVSGTSIPQKPQPRPKVEEIKYERRLFGPIEELRQMKLEDFRRLSKDPKERALKIRDKVDLLEEESFDKKMKGIAAWQESPINRLYLNIIQEAFQTGKNIQTVIKDRQAQGRKTIDWDEFQSILDLNNKLSL